MKPLKKISELKSTYAVFPNIGALVPSGSWLTIWDSNGQRGAGPTNFITPPASGHLDGEYIGTQFNAQYIEVRFVLLPNQGSTNWTELLRIAIVRSRQSGQDNTNYPTLPNDLCVPIDAKQWDVWYDKVKASTTGLFVQDPVTGQGMQSNMPHPIYLRVVIPCRMNLELKNGRVILPYPILILAQTNVSNTQWILGDVYCKFGYRDP